MKKISVLILLCSLLFSVQMFAAWDTTGIGAVPPINVMVASNGLVFAGSSVNGVYATLKKGESWIEYNTGLTTKTVWGLAVSGNNVMAGTEGGGVFKTLNNGANWSKVINGLGSLNIYAMASQGTDIYAGAEEGGIFRTSNAGANWISLKSDSITNTVYAIAASPTKVYVGTALGGLFASTDKGATWNNIGQKTFKIDIMVLAVDNNRIFVGTKNSGIFYSSDEGATWTPVNNGLKSTTITSIVINGQNIYAATKGGGVFYSNSNGSIWVEVNEDLPEMDVMSLATDGEYLFAGLASWNNAIARRLLSDIKFPDVQPPVLIFPDKDGINIDTAVTFKWNASSGSLSYNFQLSENPDMSNPVKDQDAVKNLFFTVPVLTKGKTYYWRVAANSPTSEKKWSEIWKFSTKVELFPSVLKFPPKDTTDVLVPLTFFWHKASGAVSYILQVASDSSFDTIVVNGVNITDTFRFSNELKILTQYYWKLASVGIDGAKQWSETWTFKSGLVNGVDDDILVSSGISSLYPNPAGDYLNMCINIPNESLLRIKLYSLTGELSSVLLEQQAVSGLQNLRFDIRDIQPGVYILSIQNSTNKVNKLVNIVR